MNGNSKFVNDQIGGWSLYLLIGLYDHVMLKFVIVFTKKWGNEGQ